MQTIQLALSAAGLTCAALLGLLLVRRSGWRQHPALLCLVLCLTGYLLCLAPARVCASLGWGLPALAGALALPFALWRLGRVVLEDDRRIPVAAWLGLAVLLGAGALAALDESALPAWLRIAAGGALKLCGLVFLGRALWGVWRSRMGDLVEPRRRLRGWLLGGGLVYALLVLVVEIHLGRQAPATWVALLHQAALVALLASTLLYLAGIRPQAMVLLFEMQPPAIPGAQPEPIAMRSGEPSTTQTAAETLAPAPATAPAPPSTASNAAPAHGAHDNPPDEADNSLLEQLAQLMEREQAYRNADLNLRQLADRARVPEYVLRRVIHARLGHRNFASYVNDYRLREVARHLADPSRDRRPILTLALEAGFGSIGPFNRCFRDCYGITPTQYRDSRGQSVRVHTNRAPSVSG